jgi:hypothetical protein
LRAFLLTPMANNIEALKPYRAFGFNPNHHFGFEAAA